MYQGDISHRQDDSIRAQNTCLNTLLYPSFMLCLLLCLSLFLLFFLVLVSFGLHLVVIVVVLSCPLIEIIQFSFFLFPLARSFGPIIMYLFEMTSDFETICWVGFLKLIT